MGVFTRRRSRVAGAGLATAALAVTGTMLAAAPAMAAPVDIAPGVAQAVVMDANVSLDVTIAGEEMEYAAQHSVGAVTSEFGPMYASDVIRTIFDVDFAQLDLGAWESEAATVAGPGFTGAAAQTEFATLAFELFGVPILSLGTFSAGAACPTVGDPAAFANIAGITAFGTDVTTQLQTTGYYESAPEPFAATGDYSEISAHVELILAGADTDIPSRWAGGVGLYASIVLTGEDDLGPLPVEGVVAASFALTAAECKAPPVAAGFTPTSGPAAGGTVVTIAGTGLNNVTGVLFGGSQATAVSVNPEGTAVTATAPAGSGPVALRLQFANGTTLEVPGGTFTYIASNNGGGGGGNANAGGTGAKVLAATGPGDIAPTIALGGLLFATGLGAVAVAAVRRRRA